MRKKPNVIVNMVKKGNPIDVGLPFAIRHILDMHGEFLRVLL